MEQTQVAPGTKEEKTQEKYGRFVGNITINSFIKKNYNKIIEGIKVLLN